MEIVKLFNGMDQCQTREFGVQSNSSVTENESAIFKAPFVLTRYGMRVRFIDGEDLGSP